MAFFFGKTDYFILNARAVARTNAVYLARIERRAVKIIEYCLLCFRARVCYITRLNIADFDIIIE